MKVVIIGYGKMGKIYDSVIPALYLVNPFSVQGRTTFLSIDDFIAKELRVDLAIVSSPTTTHFEITKKLLITNYNVLIEKPICLYSRQSEVLEELACDRSLLLCQSTSERYNPVVQNIINNHRTETVSYIESFRFGHKPNWGESDNVNFDLGIHDVDLWGYLFNREVLWTANVGYGDLRREIIVHDYNGTTTKYNLLSSDKNNPISLQLIAIKNLLKMKASIKNERWSESLAYIENSELGKIELLPQNFLNSGAKQFKKSINF